MKRSAIPDRTKKNTIFQEAIRRLYTTSLSVDGEVRKGIMADFSNMLRLSGYSQKFREDTLNGVISRWKQIITEVNEKKRQLHRSTKEIKRQKLLKGSVDNCTWFLKVEITTTMSVPITPASSLRNKLQEKLMDIRGPSGGKTAVVEESGRVISKSFPVPRQPKGCQYTTKCNVRDDTNCQTMGIVYSVLCKDCPEVPKIAAPDGGSRTNGIPDGIGDVPNVPNVPNRYVGTSGHSLHYRSMEHIKDIKGRGDKTSNSMKAHNKKYHQDSVNKYDRFEVGVMSSHANLMERLLTESYKIQTGGDLMNGKQEWGSSKWIHLNWSKTYT